MSVHLRDTCGDGRVQISSIWERGGEKSTIDTGPGKATVSGEPQAAASGICFGGVAGVQDGKVVVRLALD